MGVRDEGEEEVEVLVGLDSQFVAEDGLANHHVPEEDGVEDLAAEDVLAQHFVVLEAAGEEPELDLRISTGTLMRLDLKLIRFGFISRVPQPIAFTIFFRYIS